MNDVIWNEILDKYDYPKRPCDTKCIKICFDRDDCPLFQAWKQRIAADKEKLEIAEKKINRLKVEARLEEFERWLLKKFSYPHPGLSRLDKENIKAAWKAALVFTLEICSQVQKQRESRGVNIIVGHIRDELRG